MRWVLILMAGVATAALAVVALSLAGVFVFWNWYDARLVVATGARIGVPLRYCSSVPMVQSRAIHEVTFRKPVPAIFGVV